MEKKEPERRDRRYEDGVREGRLRSMEKEHGRINSITDNHERRLILIERVIYGMAGVLFLSAVWPELRHIVQ